ncbi:YqaE/Pmp3 family membrane protein [Ferrimonas balearica]|uniref:YqaE/Pmp3 family membrane protein n=1 Tax=Ferrimonas balearica TaxID=44012 RepID=UPI001C99D183|nr:YqaE/Pmp3 family membrane protein [Ferrimonas balearica]MBY5993373.1 YqaE/Pmp3 family membrane protein [Ferrimonas balearica]
MDTNKLILVIIAILLPPVAVFLHKGMGQDLVINILLCLFFWVPGILHAIWVITK